MPTNLNHRDQTEDPFLHEMNLRHKTLSTCNPEMWIGSKRNNLYFSKDTTISLHLLMLTPFHDLLRRQGASLENSEGITSKTDESSTIFIRPCHSTKSEFSKIVNNEEPDLVLEVSWVLGLIIGGLPQGTNFGPLLFI